MQGFALSQINIWSVWHQKHILTTSNKVKRFVNALYLLKPEPFSHEEKLFSQLCITMISAMTHTKNHLQKFQDFRN